MALTILRRLGVSTPRNPNKLHVLKEKYMARWAISGKTMEKLMNLPQMTDPHKIAAIRIIVNTGGALYQTSPGLLLFLIYKMITMSIRYGNSNFSPTIYSMYGFVLCGIEGRLDKGYIFGTLSQNLVKKQQTRQLVAKTSLLFYLFISHWKTHLRNSLEPLLEGYQTGIETGNLEFACACASIYGYILNVTGIIE